MSSLTLIRHLISCDGCQAIYGTAKGFDSQMEARASAYAAGWRFPNLMTTAGKPSTRTSDVCPACACNWTPQTNGAKTSRMRMLSKSEAAALDDDGLR